MAPEIHGGDDGADTALAPLVLRDDDGSLDSSNDDDESLDSFINDVESLDTDESEVEEAAAGSSEGDAPDSEAIPRARPTRRAAAVATQNLAQPNDSDTDMDHEDESEDSDSDMDHEDDSSESDN